MITLEEFKNMQQGDKFYLASFTATAATFLKENGYLKSKFEIVELELYKIVEDDWYQPDGSDEWMCWFECKIDGKICGVHTSNLVRKEFGTASFNKSHSQALTFKAAFWDLDKANDEEKKLYEKALEEYPELFI